MENPFYFTLFCRFIHFQRVAQEIAEQREKGWNCMRWLKGTMEMRKIIPFMDQSEYFVRFAVWRNSCRTALIIYAKEDDAIAFVVRKTLVWLSMRAQFLNFAILPPSAIEIANEKLLQFSHRLLDVPKGKWEQHKNKKMQEEWRCDIDEKVTEWEMQLFLLIFLKAAHTHTYAIWIYLCFVKSFMYQFLISIQPRQPSRVIRALENSFRCWKNNSGKWMYKYMFVFRV